MLTTRYNTNDCHVRSPPASLPDHCYRPFPRARREFGTSIAPCRLGILGVPFNRGECTAISLDGH